MYRKLLSARTAVMECTKSLSVIVVDPAASAGLMSSKVCPVVAPVPVKFRIRPFAHHTRPAKIVSVVPVTWGQTTTVAVAGVVFAPVKTTVIAAPAAFPVPGVSSTTATTNCAPPEPPITACAVAPPALPPAPPVKLTAGAAA